MSEVNATSAVEDCIGLGVDEIMDVEQVIVLYKRWSIS